MHMKALGGAGGSAVAVPEITELKSTELHIRERKRGEVVVLVRISGSRKKIEVGSVGQVYNLPIDSWFVDCG